MGTGDCVSCPLPTFMVHFVIYFCFKEPIVIQEPACLLFSEPRLKIFYVIRRTKILSWIQISISFLHEKCKGIAQDISLFWQIKSSAFHWDVRTRENTCVFFCELLPSVQCFIPGPSLYDFVYLHRPVVLMAMFVWVFQKVLAILVFTDRSIKSKVVHINNRFVQRVLGMSGSALWLWLWNLMPAASLLIVFFI